MIQKMRPRRNQLLRPRAARGVLVTACTLVAALPGPVRAQDAHYWSIQNGSQATLLGGAVVAIDRDLSACFYNPGSLIRGTQSNALSMFSKTNTTLTVDFDTATPLTASSSIGASAPGMFAARIPVHLRDGDVIAFSYMVRQSVNLDLSGAVLSSLTVPTQAIDLFVFQDIYDGWYGMTWSDEVGEFGVGTSVFFSSVSYRQRIESKNVVLPGGTVTAASDNLYYSFACRRLVAKGGVTWTRGPVSLGATLTLPSLRLPWSSGTVSVGHSLVDVDSVAVAEVALSRQEDLDADYREPVSVALGAEADVRAFEFYASVEWFGAVGEYDVLETRPLERQVPPESIDLPITQARERVVNIGGGVAVAATPWLSFFGSARTDKSYRSPDDQRFVGLGSYDITHVTAGVSLTSKRFEVVIGALYGSGDAEGATRATPLPGSPTVNARSDYEEKGFVVAFSADL